MVNNIQLQKELGSSTVKVTIDSTGLAKDFVKILQKVTIPKATGSQDNDPTSASFGPNDTKIVDLLRMEIRYEIDGTISQGKNVATDSNTDVEDRKDDLENMYLAGGVVTFDYDNETGITGVMEKLKITKLFTDGQDNDETGLTFLDGEAGYRVKTTIVKGVNFSG